jgi:hypothetical protein
MLPHQGLDRLPLIAAKARSQSAVALRLTYPLAQRLGRAAKLRRDGANSRPMRPVLVLARKHHPDGPIPDFRGMRRRPVADSIPLKKGNIREFRRVR